MVNETTLKITNQGLQINKPTNQLLSKGSYAEL